MKSKQGSDFSSFPILFFVFLWGFTTLPAQDDRVKAALGYPDMVLHNAKVVSMDDPSFGPEVGTIYSAIALRDDTILALGSSADMRALAGPDTKQVDLRGRTVLPAFILTHEHPTDWMFIEPEALKHVLPPDNDFLVVKYLDAAPADEQFRAFTPLFQQTVREAKPGQWIMIHFNWGPNYEYAGDVGARFYREILKERLDQIAPNNPVKIRDGFIGGVLNTRGIEELKKVFPSLSSMFRGRSQPGDAMEQRFEARGTGQSRPVEPDVIFRGRTPLLAALLKAEMEIWNAYGVSTFASSPYSYHNFQALNYLDQRGEMPARFAWGYTGPNFHEDTIRMVAGMLGNGTPYLWNVGAWSSSGSSCTTIDGPPDVKAEESCSFEPGSLGRKVLEDLIRTGNRISTMHTQGDQDIDHFMDAIESASREAGLTIEDIKAKRHAFDHASGAPRPEQIPRMKQLGVLVSMINVMLWENHRDYDTSMRVRNYGLEYANWAVPRKSVTDAEIPNGFEIDRPLPHKLFLFVQKGMTRYNDQFQQVFGAGERTDRFTQLKALTRWGAHYVLRENEQGSLETGKFADLIVLDRDFLTVPVDDIPNVKVLMTVVGGNVVHLLPELADQIGLPAAGPATWPTRPLESNYYTQ